MKLLLIFHSMIYEIMSYYLNIFKLYAFTKNCSKENTTTTKTQNLWRGNAAEIKRDNLLIKVMKMFKRNCRVNILEVKSYYSKFISVKSKWVQINTLCPPKDFYMITMPTFSRFTICSFFYRHKFRNSYSSH